MRRLLLLLLLLLTANTQAANTSRRDSLLLERIYSFRQNYTHGVKGFATNVYTKHLYQTHRRNITLWAIPSTYSIAKGERSFVSEQYSRLYFRSVSDFDHLRQVYYTTIPRNRRTLPTLAEFVTPNLYEVTMYGDHILSPFCKENKRYYRYSSVYIGHGKMRLYFRPRIVPNTQLVRGKAIVNHATGQIEQLEMEGEFDMIHFRTLTMQGDGGARALLPKLCRTSIEFKFAGNHVTSDFTTLYDCPITLPDTLDVKGDRQLMDSIRPITLTDEEIHVYHIHDSIHGLLPDSIAADTLAADTTYEHLMTQSLTPYTELDNEAEEHRPRRHDWLKEIGWDLLGSNLIHSIGTRNASGYIKLTPILNPQYISYSSSKGLSYKMRLKGEYHFTPKVYVRLRPYWGYRFKRNEFYTEVPVWLHYDPKHESNWYAYFRKGNRIGSAVVLDDIIGRIGNAPGENPDEIAGREWHYFGDNVSHLSHNMRLSKQLDISAGFTYHHRYGLHAKQLQQLGLADKYNSLAAALSLSWRPSLKAPAFTIDYERAIKAKGLHIDYERWEGDFSVKHQMTHLQQLSMRLGGGIYTRRSGSYFTDFANFRDNNLPEGWDDDWTGDFQLLDSRLYNESKYYLRSNLSYESPLIAAYLVPFFGQYVELERLYWNALNIEHTKLYSELGYGFSTRYFSIGIFASFRNLKYQEMTTKFTFELFSRW
ncbi:MAG: hypothetical protein IJ612_02710 [Prevotella sp.]|nr:hypothetical protein [Prevotella sp.]